MNALIIGLSIVCLCTAFVNVALIYGWAFRFRKYYSTQSTEWPAVSVLVAARNEEYNIERCLESLLKLDYPTHLMEILVGDDQSDDETCSLIKIYADKYPHIQVLHIEEKLGKARGKANVLAHLAKKASSNFYFITDADIEVPSSWIKALLAGVDKQTGIVNGITKVSSTWQNIDWLFALGMVKVIHDLYRPVTAMGNNMLVTREAYESVGGYESIPFSITEDFELFKHVKSRGYSVVQLAEKEAMAITRPQSNFTELLHQRKRWMLGAVQLHWPIVSLLLLQAIYFPAIIALFCLEPDVAGTLLGLKVLTQSVFILLVTHHLQVKISFLKVLMYEAYSLIVSMVSGIYYLLPLKIKWKGRKY